MPVTLRVLLVDPAEPTAERVAESLRGGGYEPLCRRVEEVTRLSEELARGEWEMVLAGGPLPGLPPERVYTEVQRIDPALPVVVLAETGEEPAAIEAVRAGAADAVAKSDLGRLPFAVARALREVPEREAARRAERQVREQAALLDAAHEAILVRDLDDRIVYWSRGAERLYGWSQADVIGQPAALLSPPDALRETEPARESALRDGQWAGELKQQTSGGGAILVESRWTLLREPDGKPRAFLVVNADITERKRLEIQFLRAQRLESLGALASGIAHDLNNVFTPITMSVELLRLPLPEEQRQTVLTTLELSATRGGELVKQILSFARGFEGQRTPLAVAPVVRDVAKMLGNTLLKVVEVHTSIPEGLWQVAGDRTQLGQVFMNLAVNARDAMPQGGKLTIVAENAVLASGLPGPDPDARPGNYLHVAVSDTGTGIPPEVLSRIFDPFFTTKPRGEGTGLGLSTVRSIVKNHGGFLTVRSEVGRGTRFSVYLPALESAAPADAAEASAAPPTGRGECVLIVDDESSIREITKVTLEANGYRVLTAGDGIEAIHLFARHLGEIRLVFLDMMMPVLDGPMTVRAMHRLGPRVPVVVASGLSTADWAGECGVRRFLPKPYTAHQLLRTVAELLRKA